MGYIYFETPSMTPAPIAVKVYIALCRNFIRSEVEKILRKNQNGFRRNRSLASDHERLKKCKILRYMTPPKN